MSEKYLSYRGRPSGSSIEAPYYLKVILDEECRILELYSCTLQGHITNKLGGWDGTIPCKDWQPISLFPLELQVDKGL